MKTLVIYHAKCLDGFTAAWVANWGVALSKYPPDTWHVDLHPGVYGEEPPDVTGREVLIVDFSYDAETLASMGDKALSVTVIDHHKTAIERLQGFTHSNVHLVLDDSRSGAYLTWQYLMAEGEEVPLIVQFVDDRDRWVFQYPGTKPYNAGLFAQPMTLVDWNYAHFHPDEMLRIGNVLLDKQAKDIQSSIENGLEWKYLLSTPRVPVVNTPSNISETCAKLLEMYPDAPYAATWWVRKDGKKVWSLRSRNGSDVDVSEIAKAFGGGGHKHAAGFTA